MSVSTVVYWAVIAAWAVGLVTPAGATGKWAFLQECQQRLVWEYGAVAPSRFEPIHTAYPPSARHLDQDGFRSWLGSVRISDTFSSVGNRLWVGAFDVATVIAGAPPERMYVVCSAAPGQPAHIAIALDSQLRAVLP